MAKPIEKRIQGEAYAVIGRQIIGVIILSLVIYASVGKMPGMSFFIGGMSYSAPDLLFINRFMRYSGSKAMNMFMTRFFAGKMVKIILRGAILVFVSMHIPLNVMWVLIGFVGCTFIFWTACMIHFSKQRGAV